MDRSNTNPPTPPKELTWKEKKEMKGILWLYKRRLTKLRKKILAKKDHKIENLRENAIESLLELNETIEILDDNGKEITKKWLETQRLEKLIKIYEEAIEDTMKVI